MKTKIFLAAIAVAAVVGCGSDSDSRGEAVGTVGEAGGAGAPAGGAGGDAGSGGRTRPTGLCVGTACSSKARGTFPSAQTTPYTLSLTVPGESARTTECPSTQSFEGEITYVISCDGAGFLLRSVSPQSPLATEGPVNLEVAVTRDAAAVFAGTVTFPMTKGPYYDGGESSDAACGATTCWAHEATVGQ